MRIWNQVLAGCVVCGFLAAGVPRAQCKEMAAAAGGKRVALLVGMNKNRVGHIGRSSSS